MDVSAITGDSHLVVGADGHASFPFPLNNGAGYAFDLVSDDCDGDGVTDCAQLAACVATDCNGNGVLDICDILGGTSQDCNGDGLPDECSPDCDGDGVSDIVEICNGTEADCNENGLPDSCELAPYFDVVFVIDGSESTQGGFDLQIDGIRAAVCGEGGFQPVISTETPIRLTVIRFEDFGQHEEVVDSVVLDSQSDPMAEFCTPVAQIAAAPTQMTYLAGALGLAEQILLEAPTAVERRVIISSDVQVADQSAAIVAADALRAMNPPAVVHTIDFSAGCGSIGSESFRRMANVFAEDSCKPVGTYSCVSAVSEFHAAIRGAVVQAMYDCDGDGILNGCGVGPTADCNCNGIADCVEIAMDPARDGDDDGILDECEATCDADVTGDFFVGFDDIVTVLSDWGPCPGCAGDTDGDGNVGFQDLLAVLSGWGWCVTPCSGVAAPQSIGDCLQQVGYDAARFEKCVEAMLLNGTP